MDKLSGNNYRVTLLSKRYITAKVMIKFKLDKTILIFLN